MAGEADATHGGTSKDRVHTRAKRAALENAIGRALPKIPSDVQQVRIGAVLQWGRLEDASDAANRARSCTDVEILRMAKLVPTQVIVLLRDRYREITTWDDEASKIDPTWNRNGTAP